MLTAFLEGGVFVAGYEQSAWQSGYDRTVINTIAVGVQVGQLLYDDQGVPFDYLFLDANSAFLGSLGRAREEILGKRASEVFTRVEPDWLSKLAQVVKTKSADRCEMLNQNLGRWFDVLTVPLGISDGFAVLFTDISELRQLQQELERSAKRQNYLLKLTGVLRSLWDEGPILEAVAHLLGEHLGGAQVAYIYLGQARGNEWHHLPGGIDLVRSGEEVVCYDTLDYPGEAERQRLLAKGVRAVILIPVFQKGNLAAALSVTHRTPRVWSADEVSAVRETAEYTWTAMERVRAETALQESEAKFRTLFETSNDGFWWLDRHGCVTEASSGLATMLGYTQEELIGRFWADFVDDAWLDKGQAEWEARRAGRSNRYEIKMKRKDGTGIWVRVGGAPVVDGKGEYTNILAAFATIAAQKTAQEELRRSQKQALKLVAELEKADQNKNEMISMLSHELRNPLATITGATELLELLVGGDERIGRIVDILKRQSEQLTELVDGLLDVTRMAHQKVVLNRQNVDLNALVENAVEDTKTDFAKRRIRLLAQISPEPVRVHGDPMRITQCIVNILRNALQYTPENGTVKIALAAQGPDAVITVQDDGIGIRPEVLDRIFEPYKQDTDFSTRHHNRGLGLGLFIVKTIMELHGGTVGASSPGPGKGSVFQMRLPAVADSK
jgi:PAS domain S-box-containing protein